MIYPHSVTITREGDTEPTYDTESGMPVSVPTATVVYDGSAFVQDDEHVHGVTESGDIERASDARVFLPRGEHDVALEDLLTVDGRTETGRVVYVSRFTTRFYTEVKVRWR